MMQRPPLIVFGAFDRHNFGDLLFAHVAAAWAAERYTPRFAGLAARDLRAEGGHRIEPLSVALHRAGAAAPILHAGGELLTCGAWEAAVMLLPAGQAQQHIANPSSDRSAAWVRDMLGLADAAPYLYAGPASSHRPILLSGVGGVALRALEPSMCAEVLDKLRCADHLSVRERRTQAQLAAAGIRATLAPDPAVMVQEYFGDVIGARQSGAQLRALRDAFPRGYIALQCSVEFADDATLDVLACQLARIAAVTGYGIVCFRAGAAPWHDDLDVYARLAARLDPDSVRIFSGIHLWDICALIAGSRAYCGSSLHGRIVAMAYALPRINILAPAQLPELSKQAAYAASWDIDGMPATVAVADIACALDAALTVDRADLRAHAAQLVAQYRVDIAAMKSVLETPAR